MLTTVSATTVVSESMADRNAQAVEIGIRDWEAGGYAISYRQTVGQWWDELECELLVRSIRRRPGLRVLDAGSGVGRVTFALAQAGCQVFAVDFSFRSLRFLCLRSSFPQRSVMATAATLTDPLPLADRCMDAAVSCQVVQHIPTHWARVLAWAHLARAVRPGGELAALVYKTWPGEPDEGRFYSGLFYHRYTPTDLAEELRAGNWEPLRMTALYRCRWSSWLPPTVPKTLETTAARAHLADDRARYLLVVARQAG